MLAGAPVRNGPACLTADKEIQDAADRGLVRSIDLGVLAVGAGNGCETLVLHVKQLRDCAACRAELVRLELEVPALHAFPVPVLHPASRSRSVR